MRALSARARARDLRLVLVGSLLVGVVALTALYRSGGAAAQEEGQTATAEEGNIVVSVGGVGRIVEATPTIQVFPRASGQIANLQASPGERVVAGQLLTTVDDGGTASAATEQARSDVATAELQLRQLRVARPADLKAARLDVRRAQADLEVLFGGSPAARRRAIDIAESNVELAKQRLDQLNAPPKSADVRAAEAELRRMEAALATLMKPTPAPRPEVLAAAQQAVVVARQNLARAQALGTPSEVSAAQLDLYRAQAELAALQQTPTTPLAEEVAAARAGVESARQNLQRLFGPPSALDVQAARLELERARADLRQLTTGPSSAARASAHQAVVSARGRLGQAASPVTIELARQAVAAARIKLAAAIRAEGLLAVRAPAAGTVTAVPVGPGALVDTTTSIATIEALDQLAVTVDLSEFDVAHVKQGQKAVVSVDALGGEPYPGTVTYVAPSGIDTNGVVTFPVQVGLRSAEDAKPGMSVSVRIVVARAADAVLVPLEAVQRDDEDQPFVTVVDESGQEVDREVTLGLVNNTNAQIVKGVSVGDEVVLVESQVQQEEE
jgi:HlyD family secretion protein